VEYDYVIVGSGFFGAICAYELKKRGKRVVVVEKRHHIGGNVYTENRDGIQVHVYGPHVFHTSDKEVWDWVNQFVTFNNYRVQTVAMVDGKAFSLPFSMWTFSKLWGISTPEEAKKIIAAQTVISGEPKNLEEQAIMLVGSEVYRKFIKGYTEKQWRKPATELPAAIIRRLPVRFTYDNNYFFDTYQGIPIGGYTQIFEKLLEGVEVNLNTDYFANKGFWDSRGKVIYTGPIDRLFDYEFGVLEYKTVQFDHQHLQQENFQGSAVVNYPDSDIPYTRIVEHKHFESTQSPTTWITYETPVDYTPQQEAMYPVNDQANNALYASYKAKAQESGILLGGRLAEYKYYDMHQVIRSALDFVSKL
jgi:UDP-galactopyranose mutase